MENLRNRFKEIQNRTYCLLRETEELIINFDINNDYSKYKDKKHFLVDISDSLWLFIFSLGQLFNESETLKGKDEFLRHIDKDLYNSHWLQRRNLVAEKNLDYISKSILKLKEDCVIFRRSAVKVLEENNKGWNDDIPLKAIIRAMDVAIGTIEIRWFIDSNIVNMDKYKEELNKYYGGVITNI